jgi:hypothetical protein
MQFANCFILKLPRTVTKSLSAVAFSAALIACGDGADGSTALVATVVVPAGDVCWAGGTKVNIGKDSNNNGVLDTDEILSSAVVCNGLDGSSGTQGPQGPQGPKGDPASTEEVLV